uniref:Uncharacterized protein n=1 Tax=Hyaloperonospora arabidopsidis (strain Emoy2) TaxID=559515 RepID=M4B7T6_HYAAE
MGRSECFLRNNSRAPLTMEVIFFVVDGVLILFPLLVALSRLSFFTHLRVHGCWKR